MNMNTDVPSNYRRFFAVARVILGLIVLVSVVYQITDRLAHNVFRPGEYFAFFTIQTALMDVVVLGVGAWLAWTTPRDTKVFTIVCVRRCGCWFTRWPGSRSHWCAGRSPAGGPTPS